MKLIDDMTVRTSWTLVIAVFLALIMGVGALGLYGLHYSEGIVSRLAIDDAARLQAGFDTTATLLRTIMGLSMVMAVAVSAVVMWGVTVNVINPLKRLVTHFERMAEGDLSQSAEQRGDNEIGRLFKALSATQQSLSHTVSTVRLGSHRINDDARLIARDNMDLSARTEQQAASLEQTAASMEELTATVSQNAENSRQASQLAQEASRQAQRGGEVIVEVQQTMQGINQSSQQMGDIIALIDSIAFQTNILALNASVEAARAGEQGKGFAVVAGEVRALAGRSASAAGDIRELIDNSLKRVGDGSELVEQASSTMQVIVESVQRATEIIAEIASASQEQSSGIGQVNQAISQIDQVTQQNAELVQNAARAASELERQAHALRDSVDLFTLTDEDSVASKGSDTPAAGHHEAQSAGTAKSAKTGGRPDTRAKTATTAPTGAHQSTRPAATSHDSDETTRVAGSNASTGTPSTTATRAGHPAPAAKSSRVTNNEDEWETF
ncbi:methyl-accepting chemotaxis sensory transducer /methyl-accepting chemotaxis sensory transducer with TarH sensor [Kushneria avicenniae]|uniref:Methyl-accepting chemotaxis sensory transducer /methyl-accepting chemotaxis sensory transducer with TarH sensor n=1 Tax=Kushneria avicenniae TaxID=402385 RepID=A0A1I1IIR1_9GAMM|nr:methyl-accepting chemotaxis protein [Kushneria avicenniae]SFC33673.1 methyl-accepting chemotaxis sensory transducer /methyl-accepting chemotaxis sensory transducer with TarH sensor [Kushneria avicenniae]